MRKKTLKDVRENNTAEILKWILKNERISRIELSESCELSPSTVSQAVSSLLEEGIIEEFSEGESTGGRKPVMLRISPQYGSVITTEITRTGVDAKIYNLLNQPLASIPIASRMVTGNALMNVICNFIDFVKAGKEGVPARVIGLGLLVQDDIPAYYLTTEFSTSLAADVIQLETAISIRCNIPVKKELINRYSLDYYLKRDEAKCSSYAYVDIGERLTASFLINNIPVKNPNGTVFDLSSIKSKHNTDTDKNTTFRNLSVDDMVDKLTRLIESGLLFFPVENIFIGGQFEELDNVVGKLSEEFSFSPVIRKAHFEQKNITSVFARQILIDNYRSLLGGI